MQYLFVSSFRFTLSHLCFNVTLTGADMFLGPWWSAGLRHCPLYTPCDARLTTTEVHVFFAVRGFLHFLLLHWFAVFARRLTVTAIRESRYILLNTEQSVEFFDNWDQCTISCLLKHFSSRKSENCDISSWVK